MTDARRPRLVLRVVAADGAHVPPVAAAGARRTAKPHGMSPTAVRKRRLVRDGRCCQCQRRPLSAPSNLCRPCWFKKVSYEHFGSACHAAELARMLEAQGGRCALTGVPLRIEPGPRTWDSASLDHLVPLSRGGSNTTANVRWLTYHANAAKADYSDRELLALARALLRTAGELPPKAEPSVAA